MFHLYIDLLENFAQYLTLISTARGINISNMADRIQNIAPIVSL